jgi:hypothetical protein
MHYMDDKHAAAINADITYFTVIKLCIKIDAVKLRNTHIPWGNVGKNSDNMVYMKEFPLDVGMIETNKGPLELGMWFWWRGRI